MDEGSFGLRRVSRRPLPIDDAAVDLLDPEPRSAVAAMWANRSAAELRVAAAFAAIAGALFEVGADPQVLAIVSRAVGEEVRHAEICRRIASRYQGTPVAWPSPAAATLPQHEGATPNVCCAMHMIGMCCLNETIAGAYLQSCFAAAEAPLAKAALSELLSDEIDHARVGWAYLASAPLSAETRDDIGVRFGPLRDATIRLWVTQNRSVLGEGVPQHGLISHEAVERAVADSIETLVVPGLASVGIRV
jgi:hypothetical protein